MEKKQKKTVIQDMRKWEDTHTHTPSEPSCTELLFSQELERLCVCVYWPKSQV